MRLIGFVLVALTFSSLAGAIVAVSSAATSNNESLEMGETIQLAENL